MQTSTIPENQKPHADRDLVQMYGKTKTIRETLLNEGRSADEIEELAKAFEEMGMNIDAPEVKQKPRSMEQIAETLFELNRSKGINYGLGEHEL